MDRSDLAGVGAVARAARARPRVEGASEPLRSDEALLELGDQLSRRGEEPRRRGRAGEHAEPCAAHRLGDQPLALDAADRARRVAGAPGDLAHQPPERHELPAEHGSGPRKLARVIGDVGTGGNDEDRVPVQRGAIGAEQVARLGGVGRSGDERERHGPAMVARAADVVARAGALPASMRRRRARPERRRSPAPRPREAWRLPWPTARRTRRATCPPRSGRAPAARGRSARSVP